MSTMFYRIVDDAAPSACWALDEVQCKETEIDDRDFAAGRHLENPGTLAVTVKRRGQPAELAFTLLEAPVATTRVADLIAEIAPGAVERFPAEVGGHAGEYEILNVVQVIDAIDRARSQYVLWRPEDGRPDKVGQFRHVLPLVIRDDIPQDVGIFRPAGWEVALIVSAKLKKELEKIGRLGVTFRPLEGGLVGERTDRPSRGTRAGAGAPRPPRGAGRREQAGSLGGEQSGPKAGQPDTRRARASTGDVDLSTVFDDVVRIAAGAGDARHGWERLVAYLEVHMEAPALGALRRTEIDEDVLRVRKQLQRLMAREPSGMKLNALWFGLFDTAIPGGPGGIGYYVAGLERFDPEVPESRCNPAWWPEGRYLRSVALEMIKVTENAAAAANREADRRLLSYGGQLGAALLVSRFASAGLWPELRRVVGFDSGDYAEIGASWKHNDTHHH